MTVQHITETDTLVETMVNLTNGAAQNLSEYASLLPALYADAPWKDETDKDDKPVKIGAYFTETFGVGAAKDGYISLPTVALDRMVTAFVSVNVKPSLSDMVAMSGASRATVARARERGGMVDETRSAGIKQGIADNSDEPDNSAQTAAHPFDLAKTLDKMDNSDIVAELVKLGPARAAQLATMLDKALASKSLAAA